MGFHPLLGDYGFEGWVQNAKGLLFANRGYEIPSINNPTAVKVLEWIKKWTDRYGAQQFAAFRASFGGGAQVEGDGLAARGAQAHRVNAGFPGFG
jgi:multiple sugar transport system substrate-binding protein